MGKTSIQWTDESWNPVVGCTRISPGCKNCYAFDLHDMRHEAYKNGKKVPEQYAEPFTVIQLKPERLPTPLKRRKPTMWFVNSVSDLFHKDVPDEFIDKVFAVMALASRHTFQVLTKRPERAAKYLNGTNTGEIFTRILQANETQPVTATMCPIAKKIRWEIDFYDRLRASETFKDVSIEKRNDPPWPLPNVWIGTSVEDQKTAEERIPHLIKATAAVRFLSCEPLLGPINLNMGNLLHLPPCPQSPCNQFTWKELECDCREYHQNWINWIIVGGESGDGARPCNIEWIRDIRDQCKAASVACFVKQLGASAVYNQCSHDPPGYVVSGFGMKDSHGGNWDEWPEDLRVREFPRSAHALTGG